MKRLLLSAFLLQPALVGLAFEPCRIEVVDKASGWPVPLVELRTTHHARFVTDNAGLIALDAPELMNRETWFEVHGHGYEVPKDGFGMRGVRLVPHPGKSLRVEVSRAIIAKRLGRLTGGGLFAESQKIGRDLDWRESGVFGSDSVQIAAHQGRQFWLWGDTVIPRYPLGIFDGSSATTPLRPLTSFQPPVRLSLEYFRDAAGRPRGVAKMPGEGPTWVTGYVDLPDRDGHSRLAAAYMKIKAPMEIYEWGLCVWNDASETFEKVRMVWHQSATSPKPPSIPEGHPTRWKDERGQEWILFGNPLPRLRCPATFEAWQDARTWEILTPQDSLACATNNTRVRPHSGSMAWNSFRQRWVTIFVEQFGKPSALGEVWYAEADAPTGPWGPALKVLTHENYSFYNPRLHPDFTPDGSPILLFEGTYTGDFADRPLRTPRYDYNQILYRLDLDDPALAPVTVRPGHPVH